MAAHSLARAADNRAVLHRVEPAYPPLAKQMRLYGDIVLLVAISPNGQVMQVQQTGGHPVLCAAAEEAVRQWTYVPAASASIVKVTVRFKQW